MVRILLVEPGYQNKYPPLGLMKISSYHKMKGDFVRFAKGEEKSILQEKWDRVYITTLFTFYWNITLRAILFYSPLVKDPKDLWIGGVLATLMEKELSKEVDATIVSGLMNRPGMLGYSDNIIVDGLIPDYDILKETTYKYMLIGLPPEEISGRVG